MLATGLPIGPCQLLAGPCQFLTTGSGHLQMMCCPAALLTFLTSHRSEYRGPGPGAQSCADSSSSPTPAWACLAPLAHTSLPRTDTGKPHPVHIPSGGGRLKEAARGLNGVGWTSERREKTLPRMDTGKPPCRAMASVVLARAKRWCEQLSVSLGSLRPPARTKRWWPVIPARGRAAPHPCRQALS